MTIEELGAEYERQYQALKAKIEELTPLLDEYSGKELYHLRKRLKIYDDMAYECRFTAALLKQYYSTE